MLVLDNDLLTPEQVDSIIKATEEDVPPPDYGIAKQKHVDSIIRATERGAPPDYGIMTQSVFNSIINAMEQGAFPPDTMFSVDDYSTVDPNTINKFMNIYIDSGYPYKRGLSNISQFMNDLDLRTLTKVLKFYDKNHKDFILYKLQNPSTRRDRQLDEEPEDEEIDVEEQDLYDAFKKHKIDLQDLIDYLTYLSHKGYNKNYRIKVIADLLAKLEDPYYIKPILLTSWPHKTITLSAALGDLLMVLDKKTIKDVIDIWKKKIPVHLEPMIYELLLGLP